MNFYIVTIVWAIYWFKFEPSLILNLAILVPFDSAIKFYILSALNVMNSWRNIYKVNIHLFMYNILSVQTHNINNIFWQQVNKTADCFNNIVFILMAKISSKKVCEKLENNSTLEKLLRVCNWNPELLGLVGATFDSKVASLRRIRKKHFIILKSLQNKVRHFLFYFFAVVDIWVVKYQLKRFGKL